MTIRFPVSAIKPFVRQGLGCSCPDPVFEQVTSEWREADGIGFRRLSAGGRLLVYLVATEPPGDLEARVMALLRQGVRERNGEGFNRLRLVVVGELSGQDADSLRERFAEEAGSDERLHLHTLSKAQVEHYQ